MGLVKHHRDRCKYAAFIPHIKAVLQANTDASFVVASDETHAVRSLRKVFGSKIIPLGDLSCAGPSRRGVRCLQNSLVEFYTISVVSRSLILSDWSSSSELIRRLTSEAVPHIMGCYPEKAEKLGFLKPLKLTFLKNP